MSPRQAREQRHCQARQNRHGIRRLFSHVVGTPVPTGRLTTDAGPGYVTLGAAALASARAVCELQKRFDVLACMVRRHRGQCPTRTGCGPFKNWKGRH